MPQEHKLILKHADQPGYTPDLDCYLRHGGYQGLRKALALGPKPLADGKSLSGPEQLREEVKLSGLRGRGGAGFSCGLKWSFVDRRSGKPIYLICNADESEPGTFKDRQILYKDPHQMIEGSLIAAYAIVAAAVFDLLDGRLARLTHSTSKFGSEYDSLCDLASFGMAPAIMLYQWALQPFGRIGFLACFLYVTCGALRLARFIFSNL